MRRTGLLETHDPDQNQGLARRPYRNICLLPYLSLETLKDNQANLLTILYNRVTYTPEQWAPYDNYLIDKQWKIGALTTSYNGSCISMNGPEYGKLTPFSKSAAHASDIIGFPRGILVLEAQMKLSDILRSIVEKLVVGSETEKDASTFSEALEFRSRKATDKSSCVEFASVFVNQPFSAPPYFSVQALLDIAQAQLNLHADHLWILQIDPSSLRRYATAMVEGSHQKHLTSHNQHVVIALKLMEDVMTFWTWEWISQGVKKIQNLEAEYKDNIFPGTALPPAYSQAVESLGALIVELIIRLGRYPHTSAHSSWLLFQMEHGVFPAFAVGGLH
jgi:hypothetical protein